MTEFFTEQDKRNLEALFRAKEDSEVLDAGRRLNEYREEAEPIVLAELRARGLKLPPSDIEEVPHRHSAPKCDECGNDVAVEMLGRSLVGVCAQCGAIPVGTTLPRAPVHGWRGGKRVIDAGS